MKEVLSPTQRFTIKLAAAIGCSSLFLAACEAPVGTHSVGRVMKHEAETHEGTKLNLYPNNRAQLPLVDKQKVEAFYLDVQDCHTETPPPVQVNKKCDTLRLNVSEQLFTQLPDQSLVQLNRGRIISPTETDS
jgi:hypothetical protein